MFDSDKLDKIIELLGKILETQQQQLRLFKQYDSDYQIEVERDGLTEIPTAR